MSIISANIMVIVDNGLSERSTLDFRLARNSCEALLRCFNLENSVVFRIISYVIA